MRPVSRDLAELRLRAEIAARAEDWPRLASYADDLREHDLEWWPHLWAPLVAVAAHRAGEDPSALLEEAVSGGFRQPDALELDRYLGDLPDWAAWSVRMAEPAAPPTTEVVRWPTVTYGPELLLDRLPADRESELRALVPAPEPGAWATCRVMLEWATTRWEHANDHVDSQDAVEVLDRAARGERFACVEYSVLLSQALNAVGIPARRVDLRGRDQHVGFGRGHVVSEAWVDDLGRWVVLDGQNGAWWGTEEEPLGVRELQGLYREGAPRPEMCTTARDVGGREQDHWWQYFDAASSSGLHWTTSVVPLFQGQPARARLVVSENAVTHPDLSQIATGVVDAGQAALVFTPTHPFAIGVDVGEARLAPAEPYPLESLPVGEHRLPVRTVTPYAVLGDQPLTVVRRDDVRRPGSPGRRSATG